MDRNFIAMRIHGSPLQFQNLLISSWLHSSPQFSNKFQNTTRFLFFPIRRSSFKVQLDPRCPSDSIGISMSKGQFGCEFKNVVHNFPYRFNFEHQKTEDAKGNQVCWSSKKKLKYYSSMLRECASKRSLGVAKAIHGLIVKDVINPDSHLWVSLVNVYAKCRYSAYARLVLAKMPDRDVVSWTALIQGLVAEGFANDSIYLFQEMQNEGIMPNEFTLATGLKACSLCMALDLGKQMHAQAFKLGLLLDLFVGSALVDLYAKCGEIELASKMFIGMPEQNDVTWNVLLNGYAQRGDVTGVLKLFCSMMELDVKCNEFTLTTVLKGCANSKNLKQGQVIHSLIIKCGYEGNEFIGCGLVDMYSKCGLAIDAIGVFKTIKKPDIVVWSALITCLDQQGQSEESIKLFHLMRLGDTLPNQYTICSLLSAATNTGNLQYGQSIHACVWKYGFETDVAVSNALVTMYMKNGCVHDGTKLYESMVDRDLISWNAYLSGLHDCGMYDRPLTIFYHMLEEGFIPNMYTFISILGSCSCLFDVHYGRQVHAHIIKNQLDDNNFVCTALIDMYAKCMYLEDADVAFNRLSVRDLFTWTVIITNYAQTNQGEKALNYFRQMQQEGVKPNEFTLAGCLSGCSSLASLEGGQQLHSMVFKSGHVSDMFVGSALVDMYAKCGCMEEAEALFEALIRRDTIAWNTIICGYAQNGQGNKALTAFRMMLDEGISPDGVTFTGILSACSHQGLVEEGKEHFNSMYRDFGISPTVDHCACMVDILGRVGKFDELEDFIQKMQLSQNALIWETVLGASKMHNNLVLGEKAANKLFELQPEEESSYILLSNIFATEGRWDDVKRVRSLMSSKGVKKEPGCSWVEANGQVHTFVSHDYSHPQIQEIHLKLDELDRELASIQYVPKTEYVLHNVGETEKKENLRFHSERLALGFALISTSSEKKIRIFKNLRICRDCHDVMKHISSITNQEIVVRDVRRFHHFKNGACSCNDFW
ncbi:pentatricopeptide repeat-containing protein At2g03880, mitochondrial isoform X1 [Cucumis sativus]|nr:pentatricopeptide repeat-containing protein At2g03880, mitochondrial isoform X1 [Cucumis sativus]XP_011659297.1 pentatricopeptide repeat-containing protein At2g03880, mitochondrial isoform X1 [Cucumis sativus]XP_011659298.1 pentatricopeptide repeat-containing protein At2g03880, mitochondrial isoform X1 [Cucumis sativus]XP_011659299.1 pentatricopeptide repeat-containing protein At2g03880, mitochondrial isoform X1 [Cucumis sativus]XP_031745036.1 pentatricopeptide repeat-containing protein At2g